MHRSAHLRGLDAKTFHPYKENKLGSKRIKKLAFLEQMDDDDDEECYHFHLVHCPCVHLLLFMHNVKFVVTLFSHTLHGSILLVVSSPSKPHTVNFVV